MGESVRWITAAEVDNALVIRSATVTLTNAQTLTLPSSPAQIVEAPGTGKSIQIISARIVIDNTAGAYTDVDAGLQTYLRLNGGASVSSLLDIGWILGDGSDIGVAETFGSYFVSGQTLKGNSDYSGAYENRALILRADNGNPAATNFAGGDPANTLKITVLYFQSDIP